MALNTLYVTYKLALHSSGHARSKWQYRHRHLTNFRLGLVLLFLRQFQGVIH